jgi:hypothetical protein
VNDRFDGVREKLQALTEEVNALRLPLKDDLPEDVRYELHRLACSFSDYTFWVRRQAQDDDFGSEPGDQMFYASEIESGGGAWGVTPREALDRYFQADVLDVERHHG